MDLQVSERDREMAGRILAAWRTWWGHLIDQYPNNIPLPDVPGVLSRLEMSSDIAAALAQARAEERAKMEGAVCDDCRANEAIRERNEARRLILRMLKAPAPKIGDPGHVAFKEARLLAEQWL